MDAMEEGQQMETGLKLSIQQYENILKHLQIMDGEVGVAFPDELLKMGESLVDLQNLATQTDENLLQSFKRNTSPDTTIQHLINKRRHLIGDILLLNERIAIKASGIKCLIAHELGKLQNGLSALSGYKQHQQTSGRIVNSSS